MWTTLLTFLLKLAGTEVAKTAIAIGVNKLLESKGDGVTGDIAKIMIDGIAKSKQNPTTKEMFVEAVGVIDDYKF